MRQAEQTDSRIGKLSRAAQQIGDGQVKLITAIAEQTNLLASERSTIEAARAGDAGRGLPTPSSRPR